MDCAKQTVRLKRKVERELLPSINSKNPYQEYGTVPATNKGPSNIISSRSVDKLPLDLGNTQSWPLLHPLAVEGGQHSRNPSCLLMPSSTSKVEILKAKKELDDWAKIERLNWQRQDQIEKDRRQSEQNQKQILRDFLGMQLAEKKQKEQMERSLKVVEMEDLRNQLTLNLKVMDSEKAKKALQRDR